MQPSDRGLGPLSWLVSLGTNSMLRNLRLINEIALSIFDLIMALSSLRNLDLEGLAS